MLHFSTVALVTLLIMALPVWHWPDWRSGLFVLGAGIGGGGGQIAMTRGYSLHRAAPITASWGRSIIFTHLLAGPVFGDYPSGWQVTGSMLVITASVLLAWSREPAQAPIRVTR